MKPHQKPFVMKTKWWAVFPVTITVGGEHLHWNDFSKTFQANCSQAKNEKMHLLNWNSSAALAQNHPSISLFCYLVKQKADFNGVFKCFLKIALERHLLQYFSHFSTPKPEKKTRALRQNPKPKQNMWPENICRCFLKFELSSLFLL